MDTFLELVILIAGTFLGLVFLIVGTFLIDEKQKIGIIYIILGIILVLLKVIQSLSSLS